MLDYVLAKSVHYFHDFKGLVYEENNTEIHLIHPIGYSWLLFMERKDLIPSLNRLLLYKDLYDLSKVPNPYSFTSSWFFEFPLLNEKEEDWEGIFDFFDCFVLNEESFISQLSTAIQISKRRLNRNCLERLAAFCLIHADPSLRMKMFLNPHISPFL